MRSQKIFHRRWAFPWRRRKHSRLPLRRSCTRPLTRAWLRVEYRGENGQTVLLRKSQGTEDNSGDFNQYPDVETLTMADADVTLKGADGRFTLALWQKDGFSYSLSLSQGQNLESWAEMLCSVK